MVKKLCCILMLIIFLLNSSIMLVISEAIDTVKSIADENKIKAFAEVKLTKYENYDTTTENSEGGSKGVLVQFNLKTGIEFTEDQEYKSIQNTLTNIAVPKIAGNKPERVEVIVKSTQATNGGKDAKYEYHSSTGILTIISENSDYNEKVEDARDEYEIICIYGSECYTNNEENKIKVTAGIYETLNNEEKITISKIIEEEYTCKDTVGGIISTEHETEDIYDGYIKANELNSENKYETTYNEKLKIMVSNKDIAQKIEVKETTTSSLYTETSINKEQVLDMLGENGSIDIVDDSSNTVKTINKNSEADENGKIKLTYAKRSQNLTIQLNNIEKEGIIEIESARVIEATAEIIDNTILTQIDIKGINTVVKEKESENGRKISNTEEVTKYERKEDNNVSTKAAISKVNVKLENDVFANVKSNNTNIILTLRTDKPKYSLFKNPTLYIEMPKEVENIDIGRTEIMYDNNIFNIVSSEVGINTNGNRVIKIQLQGCQISYNINGLVKGANIIIPVSIDLTKRLENKTSTMRCIYTNEMNSSTEVTEKKVTLLNKIANNYSKLLKASSTTQETTKAITITKDISAGDTKDIYERQIQKITLKVQNNTGSEILNVTLQDEIPNEFIYANTVNDQGISNGYVEDESITNYEKKIEKLGAGECLTFEYYIRVKQGEEIREKTVGTKAKATIEGQSDIFESNTIQNTIKESKFQIDMIATVNTKGQFAADTRISYKIVVKNITNETLTGVNITSILPEEMTFDEAFYLKYDEELKCYLRIYSEEYINKNYDESKRTVTWNIGNLEAGKEVGVLVSEKLNEMKDNKESRIVTTTASVKADNSQEYISNKEEVKEKNRSLCKVELTSNLSDKNIYEGDEFQYTVKVTNIGTLEIKDAILLDEFPKGLKGVKVEYGVGDGTKDTLDIEERVDITFSIKPGEVFTAIISMVADELDEGVKSLEVRNSVKVSAYDVNEITSNEIVNVVMKKAADSEDSAENPDDPSEPSEPTEDPDDPSDSSDPTENPDDSSDSKDPDENPDDSSDPSEPKEDPDNSSDPDNTQSEYNISGIVWLDDDQSGSRDSNESGIAGITVNLYNENEEIVTDSNGNKMSTTTGEDGKYSFTKLKKGNYVVAFLYDNQKYKITEYQKDGVSDNVNSDALESTIEEDGKEITVGLTDTIEVLNTDAQNIDLGLLKNSVFDLKLEKTIRKIIVKDSKKTKTYEYDNKKPKITKVEIDRKNVNDTTIVIEYQISVTNEGEIAGYAQEIIDYMPQEMDFNSELNSDWYLIDENLMSTSLADTLINPGETVTLGLVLTKELTEDDFTTITNTAEISEDYNEELIYDVDSTPGNNEENEDDISTVSVIIGVKTGKAVTYTVFIVILIGIVGFGCYIINKKILGKEGKNVQK